jgi:membrane fusion protein (multidrug efflux system)
VSHATHRALHPEEDPMLLDVDHPAAAPLDEQSRAPQNPAATLRKRRIARIALPVLLLLAAGAGGAAYAHGLGKESTDDAFIEGHVANIASRVPGQVARVLVTDNQLVDVGAPLVELDDRDAQVRLTAARADVGAARATLDAAEKQLALVTKTVGASLEQAQGGVTQAAGLSSSADAAVAQARADVEAAESRRVLAEIELRRSRQLRAENAVAPADLDAKQAVFDQAVAGLAQAQAHLQAAKAGGTNAAGNWTAAQGRLDAAHTAPEQVDYATAQVGVARQRVAQAEAALSAAELNLSYTTIRAPIRGRVSRKSVEPGQMVAPERPLLSLVGLDDLWIVANFKEDQVASMREGQTVRITIDAFGSREFHGHIESLAGGSGSRFALLPPDNASGNFTKVVQRIPVLVRFDGAEGGELRPGMSSYVTVSTKGR